MVSELVVFFIELVGLGLFFFFFQKFAPENPLD